MSKLIPLTKGKFATVDDADYEWLNQWKWYANGGYAFRTAGGRKNKKNIAMHRLICDAPSDSLVDHISGNTLDNRRCNLRLATTQQNTYNTKKRESVSSVFKGVSFQYNRWTSYIGFNGKFIYLGRFLTQREAARAYNEAAINHFGEYAKLNDLNILSDNDDPPLENKAKHKSIYLGVTARPKDTWVSEVWNNNKRFYLGTFKTEEDAARAYDSFIREHKLDKKTNFPD